MIFVSGQSGGLAGPFSPSLWFSSGLLLFCAVTGSLLKAEVEQEGQGQAALWSAAAWGWQTRCAELCRWAKGCWSALLKMGFKGTMAHSSFKRLKPGADR